MRISYSEPAPAGDVFASDAFDSQVGKQVPFREFDGAPAGVATIVAVEVQDGGRSVLMTVDVPDGVVR